MSADLIRTAAAQLRHQGAQGQAEGYDPQIRASAVTAMATLLDRVMSICREADHEVCQRWCSPETCDLSAALAVAREVLGTTGEAAPIRCPFDDTPLTTPKAATEHYRRAHPEQRLIGPGPWPLLGTTGEQPDVAPDVPPPGGDLPDRLCAVLTERFTALGNPFSEMRRHEKGPDGWPASHPVSPKEVAEVLRELLATGEHPDTAQPEPTVADTQLPDTDARTAFVQTGMTSMGGRAELRIEGQRPLIGRYCGAGIRKDQSSGLMILEPMLTFEWPAAAQPEPARDCPACDAGIAHTEHCPTPETHNAGCGCPSDVAAAYASCPGYEMSPSPCYCPCYGCKHSCSAHQQPTEATS